MRSHIPGVVGKCKLFMVSAIT